MEDLNEGLHLYDELIKRGFTIDNIAVIMVCFGLGILTFGFSLEIAVKGGYLNVRNT